MAILSTYTITGSDYCAGGGHVTLSLSGALTGSRRYEVQVLKNNVSDDDVADAVLVLARRAATGFTLAQIKNALNTGGIVVTVSV